MTDHTTALLNQIPWLKKEVTAPPGYQAYFTSGHADPLSGEEFQRASLNPAPYAPYERFDDKWYFLDRHEAEHGPFDTEELCRHRAGFMFQVYAEMVADAELSAQGFDAGSMEFVEPVRAVAERHGFRALSEEQQEASFERETR